MYSQPHPNSKHKQYHFEFRVSCLADYSDSDINGVDEMYRSYRFEMLEEEKEEESINSTTGKRSMSLAEIGKDNKGSTSLDGKK